MGELIRAITVGQGATLAFGGIFATLVLWMLLRGRPMRFRLQRLGLPLLLFVFYAALDGAMDLFPAQHPAQRYLGIIALLVALIALGRLLTVFVIDWLIDHRLHGDTPRIVREIIEGALAVVALLVTMRVGGVDASSVITTSAVLTAIIGLSLQDTLGNLFAGLSLQAQRPFAVGEWIQMDREGHQLGEVLEINWRATRLLTNDGSELTVPNAQLARAVIVNHSRPSRAARRSITVTIPFEVATPRVHTVIINSVAKVPGVLSDPSVVTRGFIDLGVQYTVSYVIERFEQRERIDGTVRDRVLYALARAGIPISAVVHAPATPDRTQEADRDLQERIRAVHSIDFLQDLPDDALEALARDARNAHYEPGEIVVRQGETGDELYLCRAGELAVLHAPQDGKRREIAHLSVGAMFGELAQMSGEPRSATVQAVTPCELVVIGKQAFAQILRENPSFADLISQRMAERQTALEEVGRAANSEERRSSVSMHKGRLLARVRDFFGLV